MEFVPQMKDLLKMKDKDDNSLLHATLRKNAAMFDAVLTFLELHLSPEEVM